jgi:ABC-2 type transport system permease protein
MATPLQERLDRVLGLLAKEFRQIFRDPRMARVIFVAPMIQLVVFGYAVSTDIWKTSTVVVDHDHTRASRELVDVLTASGYFEVVTRADRSADLIRALDHGDAIVGLEIPRGFATDLWAGRGADVQLLVDGTNSNTASVAQSYAERIIRSYGLRAAPMPPPVVIDFRDRPWFNPDLSSRDYNVPAVVGALILLICLLLTSLAVVREREIGTLEQLRVSPLTPGELIAGKTLPFALIGIADLTLVTSVALFWFGVPFRGSVTLLFGASVLYLLSGFMFPVSSMPAPFQWLTVVNPVRHYIDIVRAIFLKGVGIEALWPQYLGLLLLGGSLLWFAARRFHRATG